MLAIAGALIGWLGSAGLARAQQIGAPCTPPGGGPGTFQQFTDPFTGQTRIICSSSGGPAANPTRDPLMSIGPGYLYQPPQGDRYDFERGYWYGIWAGAGYWGGYSFGTTMPLGGPIQFRLFGSDGGSGVYGTADVAGTRSTGYRLSDTAGAIAPGTTTPGYRALSGGLGASMLADGTRLFDLPAAQRLLFGLSFNYDRTKSDFDALAGGATSAGAWRRNSYSLSGSVHYALDTVYFAGRGGVDWSHVDITNNVLASTAGTDGFGYSASATAGKIIPLFNTTGVAPTMIVKAPPKAMAGYAVLLDVSGRVAYNKMRDNGFTDSAGFIYGTEQLAYWTYGARANLAVAIPDRRLVWMPYVGVSLDQQADFRHTFDIPAQGGNAADTLSFDQARTWWGVQGGVNVLDRAGGIKVALTGYYRASSDTSTVGGNVMFKVPFFADEAPADSGLRVLPK